MKVAILGYAVEGKVSADYLASQGHEITICDSDPAKEVPNGWGVKLGPDYLAGLDQFDLLMRTPVIRPDIIAKANPGVDLGSKMSSGLKYLLQNCPAPTIGITGTKGKGTTTTLIAKMIEATGRKVHVGGNIGAGFLGILSDVKPDDVVVLELSSFQLIDVDRSPGIAVCLMVVPEHLDWHKDFEEYAQAKGNIFRYQKADDLAVYYPENETSTRLAKLSAGKQVPYTRKPGAIVSDGEIVMDGRAICKTTEVGLLGPHNLQNICAAITATWELVGKDVEAIRGVVTSFTGLEHRLELAGEANGVRYYDDSFSTTPETAIAAMQAFDAAKVVILGGSDKGIRFGELAKAVEDENVIHALLIGAMGPVIAKALDEVGYKHYTVVDWKNMDHLIQTASHLAESGDVVLLSPACASFGIFKNYKDRGNQFKAAVEKLVEATK